MKKNILYFENLNVLSKTKEIFELFSKFGKVIKVNLEKDPILYRSKGKGVVEMENLQNADDCIDKLNGSTVMGKIISVTRFSAIRGK